MIDDPRGARVVAVRTPEDADPEGKRPEPKYIKMSIAEQAAFLGYFTRNFMMTDGSMAAELMITIKREDMLRFETIVQTLLVMEMHGADQLIRDKIARDRRLGARK